MTLRDREIDACKAHGLIEVPCQSKKYICFAETTHGPYYFIGKHGSVRYNTRAIVTGSISVHFNEKFLRIIR